MVASVEQPPTVLVIDDEESMREGCRQVLEGEGYCAEVAENGEDGLRLLGKLAPRVVLVDLRMPGMGGLEVLEWIRRADPSITCIVITAYGTIESAVKAMQTGASDYLCKPFNDKDLLRAVRRAASRGYPETSSSEPVIRTGTRIRNAELVLEVLERAHHDQEFFAELWENGSRALAGYNLTSEEKAAIVSGDLRWIEEHVGKLTKDQMSWLDCRSQQEVW